MGHFKSNELVVEINTRLNQSVLFLPLMETLRGRWMISRVKLADTGALSGMPDLPGQHICIDVKNKSVRVVDPLGFEENAQMLNKANNLASAKSVGQVKQRPRDELVRNNMPDWELKSLLWQVLNLYDGDKVSVIQGNLPTRKQVLDMPGSLKTRYSTTNQKTSKFCVGEELQELEERYGVKRSGDLAGTTG